MLGGLWTGLERIGFLSGAHVPAEFHGALMISGFLGTLISLERAVAIGNWWAYAAPGLSAVAAAALVIDKPQFAAALFLLAGIALAINSWFVAARQLALFTVVLAVGAACWPLGTWLWMQGAEAANVTGWWLAFLVLTISAERLELSRLLSPPFSSQIIFVLAILPIIAGSARSELSSDFAILYGVGLLATTAWLVRHDIALLTIRLSGQARFSASCLLAGYFWLGLAGCLLLLDPPRAAGFSYDGAVHAITIGFVLSMIFGHAPIILPAVTGLRVGYTSALYGALALLHVSAGLRISADIFEWTEARSISGLVTVIALASYAFMLAAASRSRRSIESRKAA
ncbi:MAG TPA: hypothetical protein VFP60_08720 [Pseudolabrys sp.]|nr:hypothetical protein [Pseudolabrys sp.]